MPEQDHHYDDSDLFNPETAHESSDVPIRPLFWAVGIFIVFGIVTHIVLGLFYKGLVIAERNRMDPPETAVARPADADVPKNQPLLQPFPRTDADGRAVPPQAATPVVDMITMRAEEKKILEHYGWVDKQRGIVRIPIDNAKSLLAARLAVEGQTGGVAAVPATATTGSPVATGSQPAPAGTAVPAGSGVIAPPAGAPATATSSATTPQPATTGGNQ